MPRTKEQRCACPRASRARKQTKPPARTIERTHWLIHCDAIGHPNSKPDRSRHIWCCRTGDPKRAACARDKPALCGTNRGSKYSSTKKSSMILLYTRAWCLPLSNLTFLTSSPSKKKYTRNDKYDVGLNTSLDNDKHRKADCHVYEPRTHSAKGGIAR